MAFKIADESRMYGRYWRIDTKAKSENLPNNVDLENLKIQIAEKSKNGRVNFSAAELENLKCKNLNPKIRILVDGEFWQPLQIHVVFITDARKDNEMLDLTTSKANTAALYYQIQAKHQAQIKKSVLSWAIWDCLCKAEETNYSYSMNFVWALIFSGFFHGAEFSECFAHFKTSMIDLSSILRRLPLLFDQSTKGVEFVNNWMLQCLDVSTVGYAQAEALGARPHCMEHRQIINYGLPLERKINILQYEEKNRIAHCLTTLNIFINPYTMRVANDRVEFTKFSTGKPPKDMYDATACFVWIEDIDDKGDRIFMKPIPGKHIPGKIQNNYRNFFVEAHNAYFVTSYYHYTFENIRHDVIVDTENDKQMNPKRVFMRDYALKQTNHNLMLLPEASQKESEVLKKLRDICLEIIANCMSRDCWSSRHQARPLLRLSGSGIHANVWIDLVLKRVISRDKTLNFDMTGIWEFSKYDFSKNVMTQKMDAHVPIREAIKGFQLQQESSIAYRDMLCGPFWLLGYILDENIDNLKSTLKFLEITGQTFEFDRMEFLEEDLVALAAILQTVKYTWIQYGSSDKFVEALEAKVFKTKTKLLKYMIKANQIPLEYSDFITDCDYNFSTKNFKQQVQSTLSIRFYNLLSLCSHADSEDKESFANAHQFAFETKEGKCRIFDYYEISEWPSSKSKALKTSFSLLMQIIVNDVGLLIDSILQKNKDMKFWSEVIKYTAEFGAVSCAEAIIKQESKLSFSIDKMINDALQGIGTQNSEIKNYFSSLVFAKGLRPFIYQGTQRHYQDTKNVLGAGRANGGDGDENGGGNNDGFIKVGKKGKPH